MGFPREFYLIFIGKNVILKMLQLFTRKVVYIVSFHYIKFFIN